MNKKNRSKRAPLYNNSDVEKLDHMIDQSLVRKKNFKHYQSIANEKAIFEMIDTRIGHMLAKSCEIEAKIEAIEKKRPKRKFNSNSIQREFIPAPTISTSNKKKVFHSPQSIISVDSTETEESIPQLQSASKFLLEQNDISQNSQQSISTKQTQKTQQKKEIIRNSKRRENVKNQNKQEINFFQPEQDISPQPRQQPTGSNNATLEGLISLIQTLANEVHEMHQEQQILKGQIEKLQECVFSNE